ncbi:unnamed protein product [Clonostachys solani]|uniref:Uncharacterized protein n=1 Tax=Clonostachys solani TaxID=160281 RepID=A0A9N9Z8F0_9HYPO|nr:unnamed protein product [Clonostachys solani]
MARTGGQGMGMDMGATRTDWAGLAMADIHEQAAGRARVFLSHQDLSKRSKIKSFAGALDATDGHLHQQRVWAALIDDGGGLDQTMIASTLALTSAARSFALHQLHIAT